MVNPNRDEIIWARQVRSHYDNQIEKGVENPVLSDYFLELSVGGVKFEFLRELGLVTIVEANGTVFLSKLEDA